MPSFDTLVYYRWPDEFNAGHIAINDSGSGLYIAYWAVPGVTQPTPTQVAAYEFDPIFIANYAKARRFTDEVNGYKQPLDQLLLIYNDLLNDTTLWQNHIGTVEHVNFPSSGSVEAIPDITQIIVKKRLSLTAANKKIVLVGASSAQAISGTSKVTVALGTEMSDTANAFASNTYTCQETGMYEVSAFMQVENAAIVSLLNVYSWQLFITQGGSATNSYLLDIYNHAILGSVGSKLQGTRMLSLVSGDTLVLQVQKSLSTSMNISSAYFHVKKISDL